MSQRFGEQIGGIYETHLPVRDLARSMMFYGEKLGLELGHRVTGRGAAFYWVGGRNQGMLGLWETGNGPLNMGLHFAFRMARPDVEAACTRLARLGISPLGFSGEPVTEPVVIGWAPSLSVYFKDPDEHSIEFIAMMDEAPDLGFGIGPLSAWLSR